MKFKKTILIILLLVVGIFLYTSNKTTIESKEIPEQDAIRLRILANSNENIDQRTKLTIRDEVNKMLYPHIAGIESFQKAREVIYDMIEQINLKIGETLANLDIDTNFEVGYGKTSFPTKVYGGKVYQAGEYEALLVKLGNGSGENWWCVLFPPLCLVDISVSGDITVDEDEIIFDLYILKKIKEWLK